MKINHYGRRSYFSSFILRVKQIVKGIIILSIIGGILAGVFFIGGSIYSTKTVVTKKVKVVQSFPVLERIADCESGSGKKGTGTQFRGGQVILHANKNGTTDIGKYQINMYVWRKQATKLGYNLATKKGNTKMAEWIYLNYGTGSWKYSKKCWG